ncbi:MICOS complex subunit Mic25-like [Anas acuta]|uniref:MICOS complex subunit Mic25-like n=1 Tax=Anas acuta TaxID=28680 RepID=UPI0035C8C822
MAARPGGDGTGAARPVPATEAAASLLAASGSPVRKAHAKRAAAASLPEAPEQKRRRSGPLAAWAPSNRAPLWAISIPTAPGPGLPRKAVTITAAPQASEKASWAASGSAAPPPVPGVLRWAAGDPRGQLAELREKTRGLEDDIRSLRTELQQSREECSRWQREAEAEASEWWRLAAELQQRSAAERQRLAAELQQRHRELEELRVVARDREERLGALKAELRDVSGALSRREAEVSELEMERRRLHNRLQELKAELRDVSGALSQREAKVSELRYNSSVVLIFPGNYRPVSLTPVPEKLMEQILLRVILWHLQGKQAIRVVRHWNRLPREKTRGLEDDVRSLRTEFQQSQEECSRWQREAEAGEWWQLAAELQQRHRELITKFRLS